MRIKKDKLIRRSQRGFSLLDTLIYAVLFSLVMLGTLTILFGILNSRSQNRSQSNLWFEGDFLMRKVTWALTGIQAINEPAPGATSSRLSVSKANYAANPIVFDLADGIMRIKKGVSPPLALNDSNSLVSSLVFERIPASGTIPEAVNVTISLSSLLLGNFVQPSTTLNNTIYIRQ